MTNKPASPAVLLPSQTVQRLQERSWQMALLPPWYDVDTLDELFRQD